LLLHFEIDGFWTYLSSGTSQTKLDEALLSSGRFSDALQALTEWLGKAESYLTEDQPTLGDLDTVTILIEQHKVCQ
jgi:dystonin